MTTQQVNTLNSNGWIEFESIINDDRLIDLSRSIGQVINHPNGNVVDYLRPKTKKEAAKNTFSYNYEYAEFPFHTDTAFWNIPARFILLSCEGLSNTRTTFITYNEIYKSLTRWEFEELRKSIFLTKTPTKTFYTSFINSHAFQEFIRYDSNCMRPMNNSAHRTIELITQKLRKLQIEKIHWDKSKVFIFDNWKILHGRESIKADENRILKRIYIK